MFWLVANWAATMISPSFSRDSSSTTITGLPFFKSSKISSIELSRILQSLKRHTTKLIVEQLKHDQKDWILNLLVFYKKRHKRKSHHQLWQEGFHPQQIISDDMFRQKVAYIHYNPVKRGYVESSEHWYYSSAGDFLLTVRFGCGVEYLPPVPGETSPENRRRYRDRLYQAVHYHE